MQIPRIQMNRVYWNKGLLLHSIIFCSFLFLTSCEKKEAIDAKTSDYENLEIKKISFFCDPIDLEDIYLNFSENKYIPITIEYKGISRTAKLRVRGDTSRKKKKKSLKIRIDFPGIPGLPNTINLNAEFDDKTYIRQFLSSELMKQSGQVCFDTEHVQLYLNDDFFGLYLQVENIGENFLEENNLSLNGDLYKATKDGACLSDFDNVFEKWEKKTNKKGDYRDLQILIQELNSVPDKEFYSFVTNNFEYDQLVNILAMNMLLSNGSTYYHNYYMFHDSYGNGKWQMLPWDMDKTLSYYSWMPFKYYRTSSEWESDNPLVERCILDSIIFEDIQNQIDHLSINVFSKKNIEPIIDSLRYVLGKYIEKDTSDEVISHQIWIESLNKEVEQIEIHFSNIKTQFDTHPRSFKLKEFSKLQTDTITFCWNKSVHPQNKAINYSLVFGTDFLLQKDTTVVQNITDTTFTMNSILPEGKYYWNVTANDGENSIIGFNSKSTFKVSKGTLLPNSINQNTTLTIEGSPYLIRNSLQIPKGTTLTIEAGIEIHIREKASIECNGNISAIGTKENPIEIIPDNRSRAWEHIYLYKTSDFGIFRNVIFEDGVLNAKSTDLTIDSCLFIQDRINPYIREGRPSIIWMLRGDFHMNHTTMIGNGYGEGMNICQAEATVTNSVFKYVPDAIEYISTPKGEIYNNLVSQSPDDAIDLNYCRNVLIQQNFIMDCYDKGISIGTEQYGASKENILIKENLILNNRTGIAIKDSSVAIIYNNTILYSQRGINSYVKREDYKYGGDADISNSIITSCSQFSVQADELSKAEVSFSLLDSVFTGEKNISGNPTFIDSDAGDYRLSKSSLGFEAGKDGQNIGAFHSKRSPVVIAKAQVKSPKKNKSGTWIELTNRYIFPFDLSFYRVVIITDNKESEFVFPKGSILDGMKSFFLVSNYDKYIEQHEMSLNVMAPFPKLSKGKTRILLKNKQGDVLHEITYNEKKNPSEKIVLEFEVD